MIHYFFLHILRHLYLPILQHNVSVEVLRKALRKGGLGIDHDYVGGLESQRIDIAGK